jgi:tRNA modification GTPase
MDTIFALATAYGRSGVAVMRISGPRAFDICTALVGDRPKPGRFLHRIISDCKGQVIDTGLVLAFDRPHSFTGEDVVEFQTHGSIAVIRRLQSVILETGLARLADPGEFTRRAMINGKLDLTQVEGLGDLISAETEIQRQRA